MTIRTILCDADDTLWYDARYFRKLENYFLEICEGVGVTRYEALKELNRVLMSESGAGEARFKNAIIRCCKKINSGGLQDLQYECRKFDNHRIELLAGVREVLTSIQLEKYMVTKGNKAEQLVKVEKSGLGELFKNIFVMNSKKREEYIDIILKCDLDPAKIIIIGNSVKHDITPVIELGGMAIWLNHDENSYGNNAKLPKSAFVAENWLEVQDIVGALT
ncbi:HAD family hydrolase [Pseudoalteromonas maricaloris]|uniref:HAD family hydrolase n=1 Tax=Pseudoalteromonas maricaloris TaxID=184924 RepID=UPI003C1ACC10